MVEHDFVLLSKIIESKDLSLLRETLILNPQFVNETTEDGIPFFLLLAKTGDFALVKNIVEYSMASMNTKDKSLQTILHYAVLSGKVDCIPYLVEKVGMSALEGDTNLCTPWDIAHENHFVEIEDYFTRHYGFSYEKTYHNPIRTGMFPDPSICRVGEDYYMVNSSFIFFPCIPISHSKDLVHWEIIGHAITNPEWACIDDLEGGRGYWAADISFANGLFYITATLRLNDTGVIKRKQMITTSPTPQGPYSKPFFIDEDGIDPSLFHEDGKVYMLLNRGARIFEIDMENQKKKTEPVLLFYGDQKRAPEGPHILHHNDWYYLFLAEGGTGEGHRITVSRSKTLMGTYTPCPYNPIMRQWDASMPLQRCGHGKPVSTPDGRWFMVYLCGRMLDGKYSMLGRETALDPITWTADEWPIVNNLQGPSCQQKLPLDLSSEKDCNKTTGFSMKDFWTPRTPTLEGITLQENCDGETVLRLEGSKTDLSDVHAKNIFVRRQTAFNFCVCVDLQLSDWSNGQDAGITCYYDENTYLKFGVFKESDELHLKIVEKIDEDEHVCYSKIISFSNRISLQIETKGLKRNFSYRLSDDDTYTSLHTLSNVYYLCDEAIRKGKRFTGAMVGVYGVSEKTEQYFYFSNFLYDAE